MVLKEFRQSVRALCRIPSLTAISILTIALGVGGGTALFSVVKAVLLNPLPFKQPDRLAWIAEVNRIGRQTQVAYQNYLDWRSQSTSFESMAAMGGGPAVLSGGDVPQNTRGTSVTSEFFSVMGASVALGRTFTPEEHQAGAPVAVISYGMWQGAFGGKRDVIGRTIRVAGVTPTVIGVMQPGFDYPQQTGFWLPAEMFGDPGVGVRTGHNWRIVARIKPDASI